MYILKDLETDQMYVCGGGLVNKQKWGVKDIYIRFLAKVDSGGHSLTEVIQEKGLKGRLVQF